MPDREKVIKGLEICQKKKRAGFFCFECPYAIAEGEIDDWCIRGLYRDALALLKEQETVVRCKDCKHLFDGEHTKNCCDALMEKAGWLKEISVSQDWFCADGERRGDDA